MNQNCQSSVHCSGPTTWLSRRAVRPPVLAGDRGDSGDPGGGRYDDRGQRAEHPPDPDPARRAGQDEARQVVSGHREQHVRAARDQHQVAVRDHDGEDRERAEQRRDLGRHPAPTPRRTCRGREVAGAPAMPVLRKRAEVVGEPAWTPRRRTGSRLPATRSCRPPSRPGGPATTASRSRTEAAVGGASVGQPAAGTSNRACSASAAWSGLPFAVVGNESTRSTRTAPGGRPVASDTRARTRSWPRERSRNTTSRSSSGAATTRASWPASRSDASTRSRSSRSP